MSLGRFLLVRFNRGPLLLRRLGLGGCERRLGLRWMVLTTRGRRTARPRTVMVDVLGRDEAADLHFVCVSKGERTSWYRNILAHPSFTAEVDGRRFEARLAGALPPDRVEEVAVDFFRRHPLYTRFACLLFGIRFGDETGYRRLARTWTVVGIGPTG